MKSRRKFIAALIGALLILVAQVVVPGITWLPVLIALTTAGVVHQVYNAPVLPEKEKK